MPKEASVPLANTKSWLSAEEQFLAATIFCREALDIEMELQPESRSVAIGLHAISGLERAYGQLDFAERDYREALRIARLVNFEEGVAGFPDSLATLALQREQWTDACVWAREALALSESVGRQQLIAGSCGHLSHALLRMGRPAEAKTYALRAIDLFTRVRSPDLISARAVLAECKAALTGG